MIERVFQSRPPDGEQSPITFASPTNATPSVPAANGSSSNTPMGPFHRTVFASAMEDTNAATV